MKCLFWFGFWRGVGNADVHRDLRGVLMRLKLFACNLKC